MHSVRYNKIFQAENCTICYLYTSLFTFTTGKQGSGPPVPARAVLTIAGFDQADDVNCAHNSRVWPIRSWLLSCFGDHYPNKDFFISSAVSFPKGECVIQSPALGECLWFILHPWREPLINSPPWGEHVIHSSSLVKKKTVIQSPPIGRTCYQISSHGENMWTNLLP